MSRAWDLTPDREPDGTSLDPSGSARTAPDRPRATAAPAFDLPQGLRREPVVVRGRRYRLRGTESRLLEVVGTFRSAWTRDLTIGTHGGDTHRLEIEVRSLTAQGLVQQRRVAADRHGHSVVALSLTDAGKALLEHRRNPSAHAARETPQAIYSGWVRPAELIHDASLYRMYLEETGRLARDGSVVRRIVLDHELKRELYQALHAHPAINKADRDARMAELAAAHHLPMVDGHVQLPDLRLEVDTATGERTHVDLELITEAYHAGQLRAKARAGFAVYRAIRGTSGAGRLVRGGGSHGRGSSASSPDYISSLLSL